MLALLTIFFLAILILGHEFGHFMAAKISGIKVEEFGIGFPPKIFGKKIKGTEYTFNLLPFGGFVRIYGENVLDPKDIKHPQEAFYYQSLWKKIFVISAGVLINILIGWFAFSVVLAVGIPGGVFIENVVEGGPADLAGLKVGEMIVGFDSPESLIQYIDENRGKEIYINDKVVIPRVEVPEGEGPIGIRMLPSGIEPTSFPQNIWLGLKATFKTLGLIFVALGSFLWGVLSGNFEILSQITGPVGVFSIVRETSSLGLVYFMQLLGIISLNLAVLNIIPFPALDGGRLLFILLQKVLGEKILNRKTEIIINVVGFLFLISLMIAVTIRDIMNL